MQLFCEFKTILGFKVSLLLFSGNAGIVVGRAHTGLAFLVGGRKEGLIGKSPRKSEEGGPERLPVLDDTGILASSSLRKWLPTNEV